MRITKTIQTPLGKMVLIQEGNSLVGAWFSTQKISSKECTVGDTPLLRKVEKCLKEYFSGKPESFSSIPLKPQGTPFQEMVWKELVKIPYGKVTTYGAIAKKIAKKKGIAKMSAQAIGNAVGHNPISIIIPCHRVIGSDGSLTGYAGGLDKKRKLLALEGFTA